MKFLGLKFSMLILSLPGALAGAPLTNEVNDPFALELLSRLSEQSGNVVFSPLSIETCLALAYGGARGETGSQIAATLQRSDNTGIHQEFAASLRAVKETGNPGCQFTIANAAWLERDYPFVETYLGLLRDQYQASLNVFPPITDDKQAALVRTQIDDWVSSQTRGKIVQITRPDLPGINTRMMLFDAVYFKGAWATPFDKSMHWRSSFLLDSGQSVEVPSLCSEDTLRLAEDNEIQTLEIPYRSNQISMVIVLPKNRGRLSEIENHLRTQPIGRLCSAGSPQLVRLTLPKFRLTSEIDLKIPLMAMGIKNAFAEGADFSGISKRGGLFIEAMIHKSDLDMNEEGTEAATATGLYLGDGVPPVIPKVFNPDHPFLFLVIHKSTGSILFLGRVSDPTTPNLTINRMQKVTERLR